jgi:hypothetical protein
MKHSHHHLTGLSLLHYRFYREMPIRDHCCRRVSVAVYSVFARSCALRLGIQLQSGCPILGRPGGLLVR